MLLKNWSLRKTDEGQIYARGTVFGHERLEDRQDIRTSKIMHMYIDNAGDYLAETKSGNFYELHKSDARKENFEETQEIIGSFEMIDIKDIEKKRAERDKTVLDVRNERQGVIENFENMVQANNEEGLYLLMDKMYVKKAIFKKGENVKFIEPYIHLGMMQDSVLLKDGDIFQLGEVDFRYFPKGYMEPYHWSDGLDSIYIYNLDSQSFDFAGTYRKIKCRPKEFTKIEHLEYTGEGLFSPDAVNGKSIFSEMIKGKENSNQ